MASQEATHDEKSTECLPCAPALIPFFLRDGVDLHVSAVVLRFLPLTSVCAIAHTSQSTFEMIVRINDYIEWGRVINPLLTGPVKIGKALRFFGKRTPVLSFEQPIRVHKSAVRPEQLYVLGSIDEEDVALDLWSQSIVERTNAEYNVFQVNDAGIVFLQDYEVDANNTENAHNSRTVRIHTSALSGDSVIKSINWQKAEVVDIASQDGEINNVMKLLRKDTKVMLHSGICYDTHITFHVGDTFDSLTVGECANLMNDLPDQHRTSVRLSPCECKLMNQPRRGIPSIFQKFAPGNFSCVAVSFYDLRHRGVCDECFEFRVDVICHLCEQLRLEMISFDDVRVITDDHAQFIVKRIKESLCSGFYRRMHPLAIHGFDELANAIDCTFVYRHKLRFDCEASMEGISCMDRPIPRESIFRFVTAILL